MDHLKLLLLLTLALTFANSFIFVSNASSICSQTPHPELCQYSLTITPPETTFGDKTPQNAQHASLKLTLAQAQSIHNLISAMETSSFDDLTKAALADCLELYEDTIDDLARSTNPTAAPNDARTWLSASYANHETCKNGFIDFKLNSQLESFPFLSSTANFSKHLSNSLAISKMAFLSNNNIAKETKNRKLLVSKSDVVVVDGSQSGNKKLSTSESDDHHHAFPEWVSATDRKLLQSSSAAPRANVVVAQDGSGNYKTITEALAAHKSSYSGRFIIYVKKGVYKENVVVKRTMKNIMMVGDGIDATVVTGSKNVADGSTTFRSATFAVTGEGFIAQGMTFENTAGQAKHQAVALRSGSDFSVFHRCSFKGYQDTLYVYAKRQFYRDCTVEGTQDFIFGDAVAVLQNCNIIIRNNGGYSFNTVTAQGRKDANENTGIVIHNSRITGSGGGRSYLGRPWQQHSRTVIMRTAIDGVIDPAGWLPWSGSFALNTLYYAEYANTGAGAGTGGRVKWGGYHVLTSPAEAAKFSVGSFLAGNSWIPSTGVPFTAGL